jgi:hypothetical protein
MVILLLAVGLGVFAVFWSGFLAQKSQSFAFTPHYLAFEGVKTRIYAISETYDFTTANQTYVSPDGVTVAKGSGLFTINIMLRNDYSSDNPPPNAGTPVAPMDGTAYIRIQPILFDSNGNLIPTVNISLYDFPSPASQTGLVLASGQTLQVQLIMVTYQNTVASYTVNLELISDSIPR